MYKTADRDADVPLYVPMSRHYKMPINPEMLYVVACRL
jgi:hypothetical protein